MKSPRPPKPQTKPPTQPRPAILAAPSHVHRSRAVVPVALRREVEAVLIPAARIQRRVGELAAAISADYRDQEFVIVALLNGTVTFLADLMRCMELPLQMDLMGVSSYHGGTSSGRLEFNRPLKLSVKGRHVLLVDDILDTGKTLRAVTAELARLGAASVRTCVLLDKPAGRVGEFAADYVGFVVPHLFVVGYGLDYDEKYRNLPFVGVLKKEVYTK